NENGGPYNGVSALQDGEIASDIARFLTDSEQIPSAVAAGVKLAPDGRVLGAGGVLVQRLGGAVLPDAALTGLEENMRTHLGLSD
ncbi:Hsp33 family molecular chaperone HslO, partial [Enterococcus faecium]